MALNIAQQEAVEYTGGPLLIVAGAGTGKTTVITEKISYLIRQGLAKPEEILALTFTDKAAEEMQTRVDGLLDIGYADMQISTFHAFCQELLEKHGIDIGLPNRFKLATETDAWLLAHQHLYDLGLNYYRPLGNPTRHIHELLRHFSKCKDELITPADYLAHAEGVQLDADQPLQSVGAPVETGEKNRLTEIANAYHAYNQMLLDAATLDFGDLIFYSVKLLRERQNILSALQKQYRYILVDEFQDVNWSQYQIVRLLVSTSTESRSLPAGEAGPKPACRRGRSEVQLTVVGDDDQSIYAFRGASVSNILRFKEDFPNAKEIVLNENYRSGQEILDVAYASVQHNNPERLEVKLGVNKKLKSKKNEQVTENRDQRTVNNESGSMIPDHCSLVSGSSVEHFHLPTLDDEVRAVVEEIARLKKENSDAVWDDFAILVRANGHADPFIHALEAAGIPYEFLASSGLFRQPIVLDCINFFIAITDHQESVAIYRLLRMPFFGMKENDVQSLVHMAKKKSIGYYEALKRAREFHLSDDGLIKADALIVLIHAGMKQAQTEKPTAVLYQFLEKSGYLAYLTHEEGEGNRAVMRAIHHLKQFFDFLSRFEQTIAGTDVAHLVEHIRRLTDAGDDGKLYQPTDTPDSVNIMTIHGAKGLEFRYVFVVNMVEDRFPTRRRGEAIELPPALIKEKLPEGDYHIQEERRLFYVAMTRAKERLYLTSADDYGGARKKKVSRFLGELGFEGNKEMRKLPARTTEVVQSGGGNKGSLFFPPARDPALSDSRMGWALGEPAVTGEMGGGGGSTQYNIPNTFSFSQIKAYETCPYQYKLAHILKIPTKGSASFSFGQTIHGTLQAFYERVQALNGAKQESLFERNENGLTALRNENITVPAIDDLLKMYDEHWMPDWYSDRRQREEYYEKGKEILKLFYAAQVGRWTIPATLEGWFKIKIGDYFLHGRIDRIDTMPDGTLEIIDYKTGKAKETVTGEDKEQLLIYQIAAEALPEYRNLGSPGKLTFWYVNDNIQTSFIGNSDELLKLREKLLKTIGAIRGGDFAATPGPFACGYCDFREICEFRAT